MISVGRPVRAVAFILGLIGLSACASVKVAVPGFSKSQETVDAGYSERVALLEATEALSDQPWGEADESGMMSVLFGKGRDNQADRLVEDYLATAKADGADPVLIVMQDMHTSLANARHVAEAGRQAVVAITPVASDITMLEDAIGEARECRDMYVKALKMLDRRGANITRDEVRDVRDAFSQTIADIGQTADLVAERVSEEDGKGRYASRTATEAVYDE